MGNVILVVNPDEKYYMQKKGSEYMNNCYTPLELKKKIEKGEIEISPEVENPIQEHLWLTKYPADKAYVQITKDNEFMDIERKINAIENIISYLGGTNFCAESFDGISTRIGVDFQADGKVSAELEEIPPLNSGNSFNAQGDLSFDGKHNVKSSTKWSGKCTPESYERAKEIAKQTHLDQDSTIQYLLEQRNPKHPNQLTAKTYMVNVRRDVSANAELASSMNTSLSSLFGLDLNMKLKTDINETQQSEFKFSVEFLPSPSDNTSGPFDGEGIMPIPNLSPMPDFNEMIDAKLANFALTSALDEKVAGINSQLEKYALSEDVNEKVRILSSLFADYALSADVAEKVTVINSELEKRALSEDVNEKIESVSSRFADYALSADVAEKVVGINSELEKRALREDVDAKIESVSSRFADYALSADVAEKVAGINSELEKRALREDVDAKIESVLSRFADYALSADVGEIVAGINSELERRAQVETVSTLQQSLAFYKKTALYVSIGLGILSISGLAIAIYLCFQYVW